MADPSVAAAVIWFATQLVPSPELAVAREGPAFGVRWQVTPLLYSFGVHRGVAPFRAFIAEPMVRHSGSVELFVSPEYIGLQNVPRLPEDRWFVRPGVRAYFPLAQHGEYLSFSLGTSYAACPTLPGRSGAAWEGGVYTLFGVFGIQVTYSPTREPADLIATLSVRYF